MSKYVHYTCQAFYTKTLDVTARLAESKLRDRYEQMLAASEAENGPPLRL